MFVKDFFRYTNLKKGNFSKGGGADIFLDSLGGKSDRSPELRRAQIT